MKIKNVINDFEWVIRILESAETNLQMDCVMNCFNLWEKKYDNEKFSKKELSVINRLHTNYWYLYKNKNYKLLKNQGS